MRTLMSTAAAALVAGMLLVPAPAQAAGKVTVANEFGKAEADTTYSTKMTVRGTGFQSIKNAHGGVYVAFGTVNGNWRPSKGGKTGTNYLYVPDSETKGNKGFMRYVAFPGSDTASAANGGTLSADGSFNVELMIPGTSFTAYDRNNKPATVDCLKVQCGIITIGAHGVPNGNNESFTPVTFTKIFNDQPAAAPSEESEAPAKKKRVKAAVKVDQRTAVQGRVLAFTGTGFTPGEQVLALLDDGAAAAGPITVSQNGDLAGVMQIPAAASVGTHTLRLSATTSGTEVEQNFAIGADPELANASADTQETDWLPWAAAALAFVVFLASVTFSTLRIRSIRTTRQTAGGEG